jgi:hypothetical protein
MIAKQGALVSGVRRSGSAPDGECEAGEAKAEVFPSSCATRLVNAEQDHGGGQAISVTGWKWARRWDANSF